MSERHILVVANETVVSKALVDLIEEKAKGGDVRVTVLAPVNQPRQGYVVYYDTRRAAARRRLDKTLELLRSDHVPATGVVVETDPVSALRDAIDQLEPDEIIVSTHPQQKSGWLRRDAVEQMRRVAGRRSLRAPGRRRRGRARPGERARRRQPDRARRAPARDDSRARRSRRRRASSSSRRRATPREATKTRRSGCCAPSSLLRSEGLEVHGQISHPDPYAAVTPDDGGRARRRDHRLDVPRRALRLAPPRSGASGCARTRSSRSSTSRSTLRSR